MVALSNYIIRWQHTLFAQSIQSSSTLFQPSRCHDIYLNWSRAYLHHTERTGQIYYQSIPDLVPGERQCTYGIFLLATGALIMEYARAFNLPVREEYDRTVQWIVYSTYFPLSASHLTHADCIRSSVLSCRANNLIENGIDE